MSRQGFYKSERNAVKLKASYKGAKGLLRFGFDDGTAIMDEHSNEVMIRVESGDCFNHEEAIGKVYLPTAEEIKAECLAMQKTWSTNETALRTQVCASMGKFKTFNSVGFSGPGIRQLSVVKRSRSIRSGD